MSDKSKKISFSWDLHWHCNYRCPYCWWHGKWEEFSKRSVYPGLEKLIAVWKRIYDKYGQVHIEIAGGEPSIYPDFSKFILEILNYHTVSIMTNLSGDIDPIINSTSPNVMPERFKVGATFHPLFVKIEEFLPKVVKMRRKGMAIGVLYLSYPPQIKDIPKYKKIFEENDIFFSVSTFWGEYNGKTYPDAYTPEEIAIVDPALGTRKEEKFQTKPFNPKGKLCNAGHRYGLIHPDGEVLPCGGASYKGENIIISNLFDPNFKLWDAPRPCPSEICPCNEWAFLLQDKEGNT
jgi:MoaA/NifB/PqqE/SkfB family radical SAM enzyme